MEIRAKLKDITKDIITGKWNITFASPNLPLTELEKVAADELTIEVKKFRERRSMNANAYFHVLVGKIADVLNEDKTVVKNNLIASYGQILFINDAPAIIKTQIPPEQMLKQEQLHVRPCGTRIENELELYYYRVYRGSHEYDTKEMSILIDGTVSEAKELGIETLTPDELERMKQSWKAS